MSVERSQNYTRETWYWIAGQIIQNIFAFEFHDSDCAAPRRWSVPETIHVQGCTQEVLSFSQHVLVSHIKMSYLITGATCEMWT